jgi:hypothetical protein
MGAPHAHSSCHGPPPEVLTPPLPLPGNQTQGLCEVTAPPPRVTPTRPPVPHRRRARGREPRHLRRGRVPHTRGEPARSAWASASAASRRAGARTSRPDSRRRDDRPSPERAPRPAVARYRLGRAADPSPQHVCSRRAFVRWQVRPVHTSLRRDGRPEPRAPSRRGHAARHSARTTTLSSPIRRPAGPSIAAR